MSKSLSDTTGESALLLGRLRSGDRQALAELFSVHRERLWRTVHFRLDRRLQGRVDPDDVLQEAYLAAADRIEHFVGDSAVTFYVWLRMIVTQTSAIPLMGDQFVRPVDSDTISPEVIIQNMPTAVMRRE